MGAEYIRCNKLYSLLKNAACEGILCKLAVIRCNAFWPFVRSVFNRCNGQIIAVNPA